MPKVFPSLWGAPGEMGLSFPDACRPRRKQRPEPHKLGNGLFQESAPSAPSSRVTEDRWWAAITAFNHQVIHKVRLHKGSANLGSWSCEAPLAVHCCGYAEPHVFLRAPCLSPEARRALGMLQGLQRSAPNCPAPLDLKSQYTCCTWGESASSWSPTCTDLPFQP